MKKLIILIFITGLNLVQAQTNFEKGMQKAFQLWEEDRWDEAENLFERIAKAEKTKWLPHYYIAQMNSIKSWNIKDETVLQAQLNKAQEHLDIAITISENNPELLVIQAQVYTNWIAFDGRKYGMKYSAKVSEIYAKAYSINPQNPRVAVGKAQWGMGSARYFGQDTAPFCQQLKAALELFESFEAESDLHPKWGEKQAKESLKACKA